MRMLSRLVIQEAAYRWPVTLLLCLALTTVVSLHVYLQNSAGFANRSMQLIMKGLGHNLVILPRQAEALSYYTCSESQPSFSENVCVEMAKHNELASTYYANLLQQRLELGGETVVLTGMRPIHRKDETREKAHLFEELGPGEAWLGNAVVERLGLAAGDTVDVRERSFTVARVLPNGGSLDDYRVWVDLAVAQQLLEHPGEVNAILAFLCMQGKSLEKVLRLQQQAFDKLFPKFRVIAKMDLLEGRYQARSTTNRYLKLLLSLVLAITVAVIVVTGLQEVAERRYETGILLALGAGQLYVVLLLVAKILALAVIASVGGFLLGSYAAAGMLSPVLMTHTRPVTVVWGQLPGTVALTCATVLLAEVVPLGALIRTDPNVTLTEE